MPDSNRDTPTRAAPAVDPPGGDIKNADKPWTRQTPDGPWDAVVIGSGIGGMTAAALLAKLGKRVLVLEQHYVPGGFTHMFPRKGYVWDVGVHAVGEVTEHSLPGKILARLTDRRLEWASLGPVYEEFHFPGGFRIDFPDTPQAFRANLVEAFPDQEDAIDDWLLIVREAVGSMRGHYLARSLPRPLISAAERLIARTAGRHMRRTVDEVLDEITDDPKLRAVLTAQWGYYGIPPSRASFMAQAMVTRHYFYGAFYPVGGSGAIARELLRTVQDTGGATRILADVEEILIERGRAVGVRLAGGEEIRARQVISAIGARPTLERLLPKGTAPETWRQEASAIAAGPAHVCLYLGFKGDIRKAGASGANKWFYSIWNAHEDADAVWQIADPDAPPPVLYCSFPSLKDPRHDPGPETRHTGEVVTFVPWDAFTPWRDKTWKKRGEDYEALKARLEKHLLDGLLSHMPELRDMIDYVELSTPLSTDHFVRPKRGSIYGLEPTPQRFASAALRPRSPVRGLYLAGGDVSMGGVIGAMMGGVLAAVSAAPRLAVGWLRGVV